MLWIYHTSTWELSNSSKNQWLCCKPYWSRSNINLYKNYHPYVDISVNTLSSNVLSKIVLPSGITAVDLHQHKPETPSDQCNCFSKKYRNTSFMTEKNHNHGTVQDKPKNLTTVINLGWTAQLCRQYGGERSSNPRQRYFRDEAEWRPANCCSATAGWSEGEGRRESKWERKERRWQ